MSASLADQACSLAVALGANRPSAAGSPQQTLIAVRPQLEQLLCDWAQISLSRISCSWSPLLETAPVGGPPGQPMYCNAVLLIRGVPGAPDAEAALALLDRLRALEAQYGRDRDREVRWGPRSLDLDLLLYDDLVIDSKEVVVPHPSMWYRRFVLAPLNEIAAERIHPIFGESVEQLHVRLLNRPLAVELAMPDGITIAEVEEALPEDDFLTLQPVDTRSGQGSDCFARLAEGESRETRQPALQTERIVRVTRADSDEERINLWKQAIRDFFSAVAG